MKHMDWAKGETNPKQPWLDESRDDGKDWALLKLQDAMKISGVECWELSPSQETFLIKTTERLLKEKGETWLKENQARLKAELRMIFDEYLG